MISIRYQKRIVGWFLITGLVLLTACATSKYNQKQKAINKQLTLIYNYVSDTNLNLNQDEKNYYTKEMVSIRNLALMSLDPSATKLVLKDLKRIKNELRKTKKKKSKPKATKESDDYLKLNNKRYVEILNELK